MTDVCESFDDAALKIDALLEAANTEDILQHCESARLYAAYVHC